MFPPVNTGSPVPPKAAIVHAHLERKVASSGEPLYRRKVCPLLRIKRECAPPFAIIILIRKVFEKVCEKGLTEAARSGIIIAFPVK